MHPGQCALPTGKGGCDMAEIHKGTSLSLKFENTDVLDALERIMERHTMHYKEDFDLDKQIISRLAESQEPEDRRLLWMSRPMGTHCFRERDAFLVDSYEHNTWKFFDEQTTDPILAYAVELTGFQDGRIMGTIHTLDYHAHAERLRALALPTKQATVWFADGSCFRVPYDMRRKEIDLLQREHGALTGFRNEPEHEEELALILRRERVKRDYHSIPCDLQKHVEGLGKESVSRKLKTCQSYVQPQKEPVLKKDGQER